MKTSKNYPIKAVLCCATLLALPAAFAGGTGDTMFKQMDTNHDDRISRLEHASWAQQLFLKMDANADGILTAAEMDLGHDMKAGAHDKKDEKSSQEKIAMIDADGDGRVTKAEHDAGTEKMFTKMDTDGDGYLSKAECEAGHKTLKKDK